MTIREMMDREAIKRDMELATMKQLEHVYDALANLNTVHIKSNVAEVLITKFENIVADLKDRLVPYTGIIHPKDSDGMPIEMYDDCMSRILDESLNYIEAGTRVFGYVPISKSTSEEVSFDDVAWFDKDQVDFLKDSDYIATMNQYRKYIDDYEVSIKSLNDSWDELSSLHKLKNSLYPSTKK
jgi:hypothetical protein